MDRTPSGVSHITANDPGGLGRALSFGPQLTWGRQHIPGDRRQLPAIAGSAGSPNKAWREPGPDLSVDRKATTVAGQVALKVWNLCEGPVSMGYRAIQPIPWVTKPGPVFSSKPSKTGGLADSCSAPKLVSCDKCVVQIGLVCTNLLEALQCIKVFTMLSTVYSDPVYSSPSPT